MPRFIPSEPCNGDASGSGSDDSSSDLVSDEILDAVSEDDGVGAGLPELDPQQLQPEPERQETSVCKGRKSRRTKRHKDTEDSTKGWDQSLGDDAVMRMSKVADREAWKKMLNLCCVLHGLWKRKIIYYYRIIGSNCHIVIIIGLIIYNNNHKDYD